MRTDGTARAIRVQLGRDPLFFDGVEERGEELPRRFEFVVANEQTLVAIDDVQNQAFVRVREFYLSVSVLVLKIQKSLIESLTQTRDFVIDAKVNRLVRLNANHELVRDVFDSSLSFAVQITRGVAELHANLRLSLVQRLARLEKERHAVPTRVIDEECHRP